MPDRFEAAVAAGALASDALHRELLQSVVEVARSIFAAKASTIFLLDEEKEELVFEAVSGAGGELVGRRIPSTTGIAGWVLAARQPLVIEDVARDQRFARSVAEDIGYLPQGMMAVPILREDRPLGVLEVLDRPRRPEFSLDEIDLLALFAHQAALALDLLQRARRARTVLDRTDEAAAVGRLAARIFEGDAGRRKDALQLIDSLDRLLER